MLHNTLRLLLWNRTLVFNNNTSARRVSLTESGSSNKFDRFDTIFEYRHSVPKKLLALHSLEVYNGFNHKKNGD